ncbi:hypothetical protein RFW18_11535 [Metabacillus idriensis]|uniref:hypothetical protein n=1 Tax=Metabacillus idriensis TaxID=324768 RepID=UPI0028129E64|nr:hypothetical protein [Metabacillus idriensis]MDR0138375.1 hypothetical protein [Metabacillus idriensis]
MKMYYGVEFHSDADIKDIIADYEYCDSDGSILITDCYKQAILLKNQFISKNIYEEMHELIQLHPTEIYSSYTDYGMISESGNHYLFKEMVCHFQLKSTEFTQMKMCILQIEEHLLAVSDQTFYAGCHDSELVQKIAQSYEVTVDFDLDKQNENV